jgi:hypothetical protein
MIIIIFQLGLDLLLVCEGKNSGVGVFFSDKFEFFQLNTSSMQFFSLFCI